MDDGADQRFLDRVELGSRTDFAAEGARVQGYLFPADRAALGVRRVTGKTQHLEILVGRGRDIGESHDAVLVDPLVDLGQAE